MSPLLHWLILIVGSALGGLLVSVTWPRRHCVSCGKNRAGQMAGGTIDAPICIDCIDVKRLRVKPEDKIVIRLNHDPGQNCAERIAKLVREAFPDNKVLVLGPEVDLEVVGPASDRPPPPPTPSLGRPEVSGGRSAHRSI